MHFNQNIVSVWFSVIIVVLVIAGAIAFTFTDFMMDRLFGTRRVILICVFVAYSIYRSIRIYQLFKTMRREED